ncbi:MAG: hypothetical protein J6U05_01010 [Neisseriaceae bacterium]|nr:hypothetical protein [Neisseriaceae bacterium]
MLFLLYLNFNLIVDFWSFRQPEIAKISVSLNFCFKKKRLLCDAFFVYFRLPEKNCSLLTTHYSLLTTHCSLLTVFRLPEKKFRDK